METGIASPFSYRNWTAQQKGLSWITTWEYPLFASSHFIGEITSELGPYQIINAGSGETPTSRPVLFLRIQQHEEWQMPEMDRTQDKHYHGGTEADEIAALVSLCLGVRIKAGAASRVFGSNGDPMGRPIGWELSPDPDISATLAKNRRPILRTAIGSHSLLDATTLASFPFLTVENAIALVRAARMYQEAVWISETAPELSWIMFVSAIEVVASEWKVQAINPVEYINLLQEDLVTILKQYGGDKTEELISDVATELAPLMKAKKRFVDFIIEFLPPPPEIRPSTFAQFTWEHSNVEKVMGRIYDYRSRALHDGRPFPAPMCAPPWDAGDNHELAEIPLGLGASMRGAVWVAKDTPILLHTFEYIVRNCILNWWKKQATDKSESFVK